MTHDEDIKENSRKGEKDEDIYEEEGREDLVDNAEIDAKEEGFMQGYEEGSKMSYCQNCAKVLKQEIVEEEFDDERYRFCSTHCATSFEKKRKK